MDLKDIYRTFHTSTKNIIFSLHVIELSSSLRMSASRRMQIDKFLSPV